jgi:mannose-6-phosphate isomerase-like protein (cupin superfamily)
MVAETQQQAQVFNLRTPYLAQGRTTDNRAKTDRLTVTVKVYAEGGENGMHHHTNDDHSFIVIEGQATFHVNSEDNVLVVGPYEGIMLPCGTDYRFESSGEENLVLIRVGAIINPGGPGGRLNPSGKDIPSDSKENGRVERIERPGPGFGER